MAFNHHNNTTTFRLISESAVPPTRATRHSAAYDLYCSEWAPITLQPGQVTPVRTGVVFVRGCRPDVVLQLASRSGRYVKTGVLLHQEQTHMVLPLDQPQQYDSEGEEDVVDGGDEYYWMDDEDGTSDLPAVRRTVPGQEIVVHLHNTSDQPCTIRHGDSIAQAIPIHMHDVLDPHASVTVLAPQDYNVPIEPGKRSSFNISINGLSMRHGYYAHITGRYVFPGVVDSDYTGKIKAWTMARGSGAHELGKGEPCCTLNVYRHAATSSLAVVGLDDRTSVSHATVRDVRGAGGFGSTGERCAQ